VDGVTVLVGVNVSVGVVVAVLVVVAVGGRGVLVESTTSTDVVGEGSG
jgi:hypothetical protein